MRVLRHPGHVLREKSGAREGRAAPASAAAFGQAATARAPAQGHPVARAKRPLPGPLAALTSPVPRSLPPCRAALAPARHASTGTHPPPHGGVTPPSVTPPCDATERPRRPCCAGTGLARPLLADGAAAQRCRRRSGSGSTSRAGSVGASLPPPRGLQAAAIARGELVSLVPLLVHVLALVHVLVRGPAESTGCLLLLVAPSGAAPTPQHAPQHAEGRGALQQEAAAVALWQRCWAALCGCRRHQWLRAPGGGPGQAAPRGCPQRPGLAEAVALVAEESWHRQARQGEAVRGWGLLMDTLAASGRRCCRRF